MSKMIETYTIMIVKFYEAKLFIIYTNSKDSSKVDVVLALNYLVFQGLQLSHMADIQNASRMLPASYLRKYRLAYSKIT